MKLLSLVLCLPLFLVLAEAVTPGAFAVWLDFPRLALLLADTLLLSALAFAFAFPIALVLAVLLERTDLPGRGLCLWLLLPMLAMPAEVTATLWQNLLTMLIPGEVWVRGMLPAAWIHAMIALPWVTGCLCLGLRSVGPEIEQEGLLHLSPWAVLLRLSWRASAPFPRVALVLVLLQTMGEIAVSDQMNVRTFAGEVYTQFVMDRDRLGRASLLCVPQMLLLLWLLQGIAPRLPGGITSNERRPPLLPVRHYRRFKSLAMLAIPGVLYGLPLVLLVLQAGSARGPTTFRCGGLTDNLGGIVRTRGAVVVDSSLWAIATGLLTAWLALAIALSTRSRPAARRRMRVIMLMLLAMPGPVLGYGIKSLISRLIDLEEWVGIVDGPVRYWLYDEPNPLPVLLAQGWRFLPLAWLLLDAAVRAVPADVVESARSLGADRRTLLWRVLLPTLRGPYIVAAAAVAALSLGEVAGSKMVQIPGRETFAAEVFNQLHYGVSSTLSGLCLAMVLVVSAVAGAGGWVFARFGSNRGENLSDTGRTPYSER